MLHFFRKNVFSLRIVNLFLPALFLSLSILPAQAQTSVQSLAQALQQPGLSPQSTAIRVVSMKTGKEIISKNASQALMPASNMKIITSAAALTLLKPEFRFKTQFLTDGYVSGSTLKGNLYLKGFGDPVLSDERLAELVQELRYAGVETITGDLYVDDSFFDNQQTGKGWKTSYGAASYSARISALSLNLNTVEVRVRPTQAGQPAAINLKPANTFFEIVNQTRTSAGRTSLKISRDLVNGKNRIIVSGNIYVRGRTEIEQINLDKPSLYVGNVTQGLLKREQIQLQGRLRKADTPAGSRILAITLSPPLNEVVAELNKKSINLIAENLLKFLGATFKGAPGTAEKGAAVIKEQFLVAQVGLPANLPIVIADGSGLSPLNRMTADVLTRVLQHMFEQFDVSVDFMSSMAIAGVDGTLKKRMNTPELKRRVRAKTGFINGVSSLSGYVYTKNNDVVIFSILMNHFNNYTTAITTQNRLCQLLVNWQD